MPPNGFCHHIPHHPLQPRPNIQLCTPNRPDKTLHKTDMKTDKEQALNLTNARKYGKYLQVIGQTADKRVESTDK